MQHVLFPLIVAITINSTKMDWYIVSFLIIGLNTNLTTTCRQIIHFKSF